MWCFMFMILVIVDDCVLSAIFICGSSRYCGYNRAKPCRTAKVFNTGLYDFNSRYPKGRHGETYSSESISATTSGFPFPLLILGRGLFTPGHAMFVAFARRLL